MSNRIACPTCGALPGRHCPDLEPHAARIDAHAEFVASTRDRLSMGRPVKSSRAEYVTVMERLGVPPGALPWDEQ